MIRSMQSHTPNCMHSGHESEEKVTTLNDTIMKCEFPLNICRVIDLNEQKGCKTTQDLGYDPI